MTKLSTIPDHQLSITCGLCKHHSMLEVANLILVVGGDTTAHETRQKARCDNCGVKAKQHVSDRTGGVTQVWRLMVLGLGQPRVFNPINDFVFLPY